MAFINWEDKYSVGVPSVDTQHKKLIQFTNDLHDAMSQGKGKEVIGRTLDSLVEYTKTHFQDEEKLMEKYKYPLLSAHHLEHMGFVKKVLEFQNQFAAGTATLTVPLMTFLKDWLINHILKTDKQYAPYIK